MLLFQKNIGILNWMVSDQCSFSDHFYIFFEVNFTLADSESHRSCLIWQKFAKSLQKYKPKIPDTISKNWIDDATNELLERIDFAIVSSTRVTSSGSNEIYDGELVRLKRVSRKAFKNWYKNRKKDN